MSKRVVPLLCALLLAAFPALSLYAHNQPELELSVLAVPLTVSLASAAAAYLVGLALTRSATKAGLLSSLLVISFFYYGLVFSPGRSWFLAVWLLVLVVGVVIVLWTKREVFPVATVLAVAAAVKVVPQAAGVIAYRVKHPPVSATDPRLWPAALEQPTRPSASSLPDIFVLMPDDYARADVLQKYFHFDNSNFLQALETRGFTVSDQVRSPYSFSELNMSSMLNLDYLTKLPTVLGKDSRDFTTVKRLMANNRASRVLAGLGYDYVHLDTDEVTFSGGNPRIPAVAPPDSFRSLWLSKTVLSTVDGHFGFTQAAKNARFRASVHSVFSQLKQLRTGRRPKFVVFHTLMPHDPYVFDAKGGPVLFPAAADHTGAAGMSYYEEELKYLNGQLLAAIDAIRAQATTPPVIVLQADEGFEANPELFGEKAARDMRVKGFGAFLLPGSGPGSGAVPQPPNTVNNLRYVFNRYLGTHYPMLPSASHVESDLPYDFKPIDVQ